MTQSSMETTQFDLIEWRKAKVLELHSQGKTEREIADILKVSQSPVHRDIVELRQEASKGIEVFIENVPYEWKRGLTSIDILLRRAYEIFEKSDGLELGDQLSLIDTLKNLTLTRVNFFADSEVLKRARDERLALQNKINALEQEKKKEQPRYEVTRVEESVSGGKGKIKTVARRIEKKPAKVKAVV
jgi:hypothetical protein